MQAAATDPMVVYMLLNRVNDMVYVGQTTKPLNARLTEHRGAAKRGRRGLLYDDIRACGWDAFEAVVLERCETIEQLNAYERLWIEETSACDHGVGYNQREGGHNKRLSEGARRACREAGRRGASQRAQDPTRRRVQALDALTPEQRREFFRECGKKGGRRRDEMSEEERERFRQWGRLGARKTAPS